MPLDQEYIDQLLQKYKDNTATEAEKEELTAWYREKAYHDAEFPEHEAEVGATMLTRLNHEIKSRKLVPSTVDPGPWTEDLLRTPWLAAASVLLVMGIAMGVVYYAIAPETNKITAVADSDVGPGGNKAILTLADGSQISLADVADGAIASQQNIQISKAGNGQLVYTLAKTDETARRSHDVNVIDIPKGGQYQVVLPDGSKVWLNASSSLRLPLNIASGGERRVELKGEAYFEVTHDPQRPFTVVSARQTVSVLGTHFNIKAYPDETDIKTSLLEGRVRVTAGTQRVVLAPGQQAQLTDHIAVTEVNTEDAIAWKNGYFHFDDERLEDIMRSVARWYDVKVVFEEESLKEETFGAVTTRFASISALLRVMEQTGNVKFQIENKTIRITAKTPT